MFDSFNFWDIVLLLVVLGMAVPLAYVRQVSYKAFIMSLPFPGTVAMLSLGQDVDASNILGLPLLLLFSLLVRYLYYHRILKIIPAIIAGTAVYVVIGSILNMIYPKTASGFWTAVIINFAIAAAVLYFMEKRREPGQKSKMPVAVKVLIITVIISGLIILKKTLGGFMVVFPMVSMIAMYESRYSLWTISRQMAIVMLTIGLMFTTIFILQNIIGFYFALACGWGTAVAVILPLHYQNFSSGNKALKKLPPVKKNPS